MHLEAMPRTPNGKVDKKALPQPMGLSIKSDHYVAPESKIQSALVEIWSSILKREHIGIHDNFFKVGGHSLKATQLLTRLNRKFQVNLKLSDLFSHPYLYEQAEIIEKTGASEYVEIAPVA